MKIQENSFEFKTFRERISQFINLNYNNKSTAKTVRASLKFIIEAEQEGLVNETSDLVEFLNEWVYEKINNPYEKVKNNSIITVISWVKSYMKWSNNFYKTNYEPFRIEKVADDWQPKEPYTPREWEILRNELRSFNKPAFEFMFLAQWANSSRASEIIRVDWEQLKEDNIDVELSKTKDAIIKRTILLPNEPELMLLDFFWQHREEIIKYKVKTTYLNDFTRFSHFVKEKHPDFEKAISSHCLRADKITQMAADGMTLEQIMSITKHTSAQTVYKHYINANKETSKRNLRLANMTKLKKVETQEEVRKLRQLEQDTIQFKSYNRELNETILKQREINLNQAELINSLKREIKDLKEYIFLQKKRISNLKENK